MGNKFCQYGSLLWIKLATAIDKIGGFGEEMAGTAHPTRIMTNVNIEHRIKKNKEEITKSQ